MKLPALAIAAAFAGGISLGLHPAVASHAGSRVLVAGVLLFSIAALLTALLLSRRWLEVAAAFSVAAWIALGLFAFCIAAQPLPADHVLQRIAANQLDLKSPLRWHGRLRNEPSQVSWGYQTDIDLNSVDTAEGELPLRGGMRLGFSPQPEDRSISGLHAGDSVEVTAQARRPLTFRNPGAFDRREYLAAQNIHLLATLRASSLLTRISGAQPSFTTRVARLRADLRQRLDAMFPDSSQQAGILRAMLLGDRTFIDRTELLDFQKTGVFHVLVVAGLHVGALAAFLFWLGRVLRLPSSLATILILALLFAYIAVVEQRAPVLRAGLMAGIVVLAGYFYRRLELVNSAALAALALLVANPKNLFDTGFQLSFLAIGCIGGLALPYLERHIQPYLQALRGWRDVTRDGSYAARIVQFRLDLRDAVRWLTVRISGKAHRASETVLVGGFRCTLRLAELFLLSLVLQGGMLPLLVRDFHRIPLGWLVSLQGNIVAYLARIPHSSYRIAGPPVWVLILFFASALAVAGLLRSEQRSRRWPMRIASLLLFLAAALVATHPFPAQFTSNTLEVCVLDVAQGDSILVVSPKGSTLLIDGGGTFGGFPGREEHQGTDPGEEAVSPYLWSRGIKRLDAVALTHAHQDHIGGLTAVLQNFAVSRLFVGRETSGSTFPRLMELAARNHVSVEQEMRGKSFDWRS